MYYNALPEIDTVFVSWRHHHLSVKKKEAWEYDYCTKNQSGIVSKEGKIFNNKVWSSVNGGSNVNPSAC